MNELGLDVIQAVPWFVQVQDTPYLLVRVNADVANTWPDVLKDALRRSYLSDEFLRARVDALAEELQGTAEQRQAIIIASKLPDPGAVMAGEFGELLAYIYHAAKSHPANAFGAKKHRLKFDRTKATLLSDVVQFVLPNWPDASDADELLCSEVKMKATGGAHTPIADAIEGCLMDRTKRLSRTLEWLKERAISESLGVARIQHLDRFIKATDYPAAKKRFFAVAVISADLFDAEALTAPPQAPSEYTLILISVPGLHGIYNTTFTQAKLSKLPPAPVA